MPKDLPALLVDLVELLLVAAGSVVVSGAGLVMESRAVEALFGGNLPLGAWLLFMGAVALYLGVYLLGYGRFRSRLGGLRAEL